jgi:hypothetical protein
MVHYGKDRIVTVALWQTGDEVHGHSLERFGIQGSIDFVDGDSGAVSVNLVLLALTAALDIAYHPRGHAGLPEDSLYLMESFISAWVSCSWCVVGVGHDALFEFEVWRDN